MKPAQCAWLLSLLGALPQCLSAPHTSYDLELLESWAPPRDTYAPDGFEIEDLVEENLDGDPEFDDLRDEDPDVILREEYSPFNADQTVLDEPPTDEEPFDEPVITASSLTCSSNGGSGFYIGQSQVIVPKIQNTGGNNWEKVVVETADLGQWNLSFVKGWGCSGSGKKMRCEQRNMPPNAVRTPSGMIKLGKYGGSTISLPITLTAYTNGRVSHRDDCKMNWNVRQPLAYTQSQPGKFYQPRRFTLAALPSAEGERQRLQQQFKWTDFQPTGYYLNPSSPLSVHVSGASDSGPKPQLVVGTPALVHPDYNKEQIPGQLTELPALKNGMNNVVSTFGGIIYVRYSYSPSEQRPNPVTVTLEGGAAQPFPFFREGITTDDQWKTMLSITDIPFAEHAGKRITITGLASHVKVYADKGQKQQELLDTYGEIIDAENAISALRPAIRNPRDQPSPLRPIVVETQDGVNPTSFHYRAAIPVYAREQIWWQPKTRTSWMMYHELGHQRQHSSTWSWRAMMEVTVNIYSLAALRHFSPPGYRPVKEWNDAKQYLAKADSQKDFDKAGFYISLVMFEQVRVVFGDRLYHALHTLSRRTPDQGSDSDKKHFFMVKVAQLTNQNLTEYFTKWGLKPEQRTIDEMGKLPRPSEDYTKRPVYGAKQRGN
ncbi:peptidase M60-like family-domain-containing protein [Aspergillus avenaceus]|uniref:Peptidase M60-like family-domain-containing protein n=1 Tax=Aspergillus avenaceus TaxID=36643 RepID=A0A5N6U700_ASPAV|nr:peptidase M60-like family-domain-containing protein [Aspergillus avenaceus]